MVEQDSKILRTIASGIEVQTDARSLEPVLKQVVDEVFNQFSRQHQHSIWKPRVTVGCVDFILETIVEDIRILALEFEEPFALNWLELRALPWNRWRNH